MKITASIHTIRLLGRAHQIAQAFGHRRAASYLHKRGVSFNLAYVAMFNRQPAKG